MPSDLTTIEARALGARYLAAVGGVWPVHGGLARWDDGTICQRLDGFDPGDESRPASEWWPDLRDPATRGAALEVVRERRKCPLAHVHALDKADNSGVVWEAVSRLALPYTSLGMGDSEAEAIVVALEAAR